MQYQDNEIWIAIYCRLSEEDRDKRHEIDDSRSIQNQKSMLLSYAQTNQWKVYKVYSDDDYTGADRNRPAFNELLKDAEAKKFQIVICKSQSRFTREMELVEKYLHELFPIWGIRFIGLVDNADTANKGNKKARQINGLVNEWYLEDLSENIKEVLTDRRKKGYHIGSFAAYGYKKDPDYKGHLLPDEEAASVVHRIFELYAAGTGKSQIARILNAERIPNPTEYKILHGIRWNRRTDKERSSLWQYFSIADILVNEVYIGHMVQGRYESISYKTHQNKPRSKDQWIRVENTHAPIIERELWDKVQEIRQKRTKPGWDGDVGIFARKTQCMYCGYTMASCKTSNRKYLQCSSRKIKEDACIGGFIGQKELSETVLSELYTIIKEYLDLDAAEEQLQIRDENKRKKEGFKRELLKFENKVEEVEKTLKILYEDRAHGIIAPEEYARLSESFRKDVEAYEGRINTLKEKIAEFEAKKDDEKNKREILERFSNITELSYDIVNTLIDYIEIGKREGHYRSGKVPVVIHWRF